MSSNTLADAFESLCSALKVLSTKNIRYQAYAVAVHPPSIVVGPPIPKYEAYASTEPTSVDFVIYLVVPMNGEAAASLLDKLPAVIEAVESEPGISIEPDGVRPTVYIDPTGGAFPCYTITASAALS